MTGTGSPPDANTRISGPGRPRLNTITPSAFYVPPVRSIIAAALAFWSVMTMLAGVATSFSLRYKKGVQVMKDLGTTAYRQS